MDYFDLANEYQQNGKYDLAIENYLKAINKEPENTKIYNALAICYYCKKDYESAIKTYEKALKVCPDYAMAYNNLGIIYSDRQEYDLAINNYKKAIEIHPEYTAAYNNLGNAYNNTKEYDKAIQNFKKAIELKPNYADAYCNMGIALYKLDNNDEAIEYFNKALELNPNNAETYNNLGILYSYKRLFDLSISSYLKAIELNPNFVDPYSNMSTAYLTLQEFEIGWKLYEYRYYVKEPTIVIPHFSKPRWYGETNIKNLFVYMEAGLGDVIMFARYFPVLKNMGLNIISWVPDSLTDFFKFNFPYVTFITEAERLKDDEYDFYISSMSLPHVLKTTPATIPLSSGYLKAEPEKVKKYKEKYFNNDCFKIGLVWQCKNRFRKDAVRSIHDIKIFEKLSKFKNVKFYSVLKGESENQIQTLSESFIIEPLGNTFDDFSDTAAAIENLDLLITVDTSTAHLGGGLKKPTWIMIPFESDWRWFLDLNESPWYDSAKLFKQKESGNWEELFDRVYAELNLILSKGA